MTRHKIVNGIKVNFTAEEEAQRDAEQAQDVIDLEAKRNASIQKATDKANAKAKLIAGEPLTEAEADTLVL